MQTKYTTIKTTLRETSPFQLSILKKKHRNSYWLTIKLDLISLMFLYFTFKLRYNLLFGIDVYSPRAGSQLEWMYVLQKEACLFTLTTDTNWLHVWRQDVSAYVLKLIGMHHTKMPKDYDYNYDTELLEHCVKKVTRIQQSSSGKRVGLEFDECKLEVSIS